MKKIILDKGWVLKKTDRSAFPEKMMSSYFSKDTYSINQMPMQIADVLLEQGIIEEPWKPGKASEYKWIAESDWVYATKFKLPNIDGKWVLSCAGLDLFAEVYINDIKVASHANSYIPLETRLEDVLRPGETNTLVIYISSTYKKLLKITPEMDGERLTARVEAANLRKSNCDFFEYLGPRPYFIRLGVFGEVALIAEETGIFTESILDTQVNDAMNKGFLKVSVKGHHKGEACLVVEITDPLGHVYKAEGPVLDNEFSSEKIIVVENPELWHPRGYGPQNIYTVKAILMVDGQEADTKSWKTGFRKLEMPSPLHFIINGKKVRLYGGNWAPLSAVSNCWDDERAEKLLALAVASNYNALRIWAWGTPPPESFYERAEELGLMIWQDFFRMSTTMKPNDRKNNLLEAAYYINSLKHHPAILLWCGGNESLMFHHWAHGDVPMPGRDVFEKDLRALCEKMDPSRIFLPESPWGGQDYSDPRYWDTHTYTSYSFVPGYDYLNFASEDFRVSAPALRSCRKFIPENDLWPEGYTQVFRPGDMTEFPEQWLNYSACVESELKFGPVWEFYDAVDAESMIHKIGMAAGVFYRNTIERLRRGRPSGTPGHERCCGGYLVWKFNDSWPQIYGAKVDYFLEPFIPYYYIRRAYDPIQISFDIGNFIYVWLVNDSAYPVSGVLHVKLYHIGKNEVTKEQTYHVSVAPDESVEIADLTEKFHTFRRQNILFAELKNNRGEILARTAQIVGVERYIRFPKATLSVQTSHEELLITTDKYAHCVYLEGEEDGDAFGWFFDDNYFSLVPGEEKHVKINGNHKSGIIKARDFYSGIVTQVQYKK